MLKFPDIFGQDKAIAWIRQACLADRLPHGLIFAGPPGVGKAAAAQALAALFLCDKPHGTEPCGHCPACIIFATGNHPDYHVIIKEMIRSYDRTGESKATDLSIHVIRPELIEAASRKSSMNRGKVFVIEQAELMNTSAQNASLKTLEEPAGRTLIILLADDPNSLLPTIRSRCQVVRFAALDESRVLSELHKRGINPADAADAALFADGSLGQALLWLEDGVIARARELQSRLDSLLAGEPSADLADWFKLVSEEYAARQMARDELCSKSQMTRDGMSLYLRLAGQLLRRRLAQTTDADALEALCSGIDALVRAEQFLNSNVTVPLIFQQLAVKLEKLFAYVNH